MSHTALTLNEYPRPQLHVSADSFNVFVQLWDDGKQKWLMTLTSEEAETVSLWLRRAAAEVDASTASSRALDDAERTKRIMSGKAS